jgi:hypothetical protein
MALPATRLQAIALTNNFDRFCMGRFPVMKMQASVFIPSPAGIVQIISREAGCFFWDLDIKISEFR